MLPDRMAWTWAFCWLEGGCNLSPRRAARDSEPAGCRHSSVRGDTAQLGDDCYSSSLDFAAPCSAVLPARGLQIRTRLMTASGLRPGRSLRNYSRE